MVPHDHGAATRYVIGDDGVPRVHDAGWGNITIEDMSELIFGSSQYQGYFQKARTRKAIEEGRTLSLDRLGVGCFFHAEYEEYCQYNKINDYNHPPTRTWVRSPRVKLHVSSLQVTYQEPAEYLAALDQAYLDHYKDRRVLIEDMETGRAFAIPLICRGMAAYQANQGLKFDLLRNYFVANKTPLAFIVFKQWAPPGQSPVQSLAQFKGLSNDIRSFIKKRLGYSPQLITTLEFTKRGQAHLNVLLPLEDKDDLQKVTGPIQTGKKGGRIDWQSSDLGSWMEKKGLGDAIHSVTIETSWGNEDESEEEAQERFIGYVTKYVTKDMGLKGHPVGNGLLKLSGRRTFSISNSLMFQAVKWATEVFLLGQQYELLKARRRKVKEAADAYNKSLKDSQEKYVKRMSQFVASRTCLETTSNSNQYQRVAITEASLINSYLLSLTYRGLGRPPPGAIKEDFWAFEKGTLQLKAAPPPDVGSREGPSPEGPTCGPSLPLNEQGFPPESGYPLPCSSSSSQGSSFYRPTWERPPAEDDSSRQRPPLEAVLYSPNFLEHRDDMDEHRKKLIQRSQEYLAFHGSQAGDSAEVPAERKGGEQSD